jgi:tRNA dimethylallyltransferase
VAEATALAGEIRARGRLPLLVGGTMLYFKALRDGLDAIPAADPALRAAIDARAAALGWPALHAELARVDPAMAARLAPADAQRIQRALEVWQLSGQPLSALQQRAASARAGAVQPAQAWPMVSLEPADRSWLHQRIAQRFDAMLAAGLVDEVQALRARGDLHPDLPSMRSVGYRQLWRAIEQGDPATAREPGIAATRQLAKRQLTWLRSMPERAVVPCDSPDALALGLQALKQKWHRSC